MKPVVLPLTAVLLAPLVMGACEKSDNVSQLHAEAVATAKYYAPRVDELDKRRQTIFQRGRNVPGNLPDVPEIVRLIGEASDKVNEMKGITGSLEKQADEAAKANKVDELEKLNDESSEKLDTDWTIANDDMTHVEGWLWQYEQARGQRPPAPPPPVPTQNDTGEPPPAAATGSGAGAAGKPEEKPAEKAAAKAATEKADKAAPKAPADKAAAPKAAAPKAAAPKAAAPKAAAPKAAGSAAGSATK